MSQALELYSLPGLLPLGQKTYPIILDCRGLSVFVSPSTVQRCLPELFRQWKRQKNPEMPLKLLEALDVPEDHFHLKALKTVVTYMYERSRFRVDPDTFFEALEEFLHRRSPPACCRRFYALQLLEAFSHLLSSQAFGCGPQIFQQFTTFVTKYCDDFLGDHQLWLDTLKALDRMANWSSTSRMRTFLQVAAREINGPREHIIEQCRNYSLSPWVCDELERLLQLKKMRRVQSLRQLRPIRIGDTGRAASHSGCPMRRSDNHSMGKGRQVVLEVVKDASDAIVKNVQQRLLAECLTPSPPIHSCAEFGLMEDLEPSGHHERSYLADYP